MNTAIVSAAMTYINSTVIKEAFQRNWLSPFASPDSSPLRVLVTSKKIRCFSRLFVCCGFQLPHY